MVTGCVQTSAQLLSLENGDGLCTNISTVIITREWWWTVYKHQHSYYHSRMVTDCVQTSAQLLSLENGEGPSSNLQQLQSLSLRHATRSGKDTDGQNIPKAKQNVQHCSHYLKHHFTEWIAMLFITSTEGKLHKKFGLSITKLYIPQCWESVFKQQCKTRPIMLHENGKLGCNTSHMNAMIAQVV